MKTIEIRVVPRAKNNTVKKIGSGFKVYLTAAPVDGKANRALVKVLAEYFGLRRSQVRVIKGVKARDKIVVISE